MTCLDLTIVQGRCCCLCARRWRTYKKIITSVLHFNILRTFGLKKTSVQATRWHRFPTERENKLRLGALISLSLAVVVPDSAPLFHFFPTKVDSHRNSAACGINSRMTARLEHNQRKRSEFHPQPAADPSGSGALKQFLNSC